MRRVSSFQPTPADVYDELGLGALSTGEPAEILYLDMVKRAFDWRLNQFHLRRR